MYFGEHITTISERGWRWFSERAHSPHALGWLVVLAFLEPIISPIVPETLMVAMLLAGSDDRRWKKYAAITTAASFLGGITSYGIGFLAFRTLGEALLSSYGLGELHSTIGSLLGQNIFLLMVFVTFTPVPDKLFALMGGFLGVPLLPFAAGFLIGRAGRFGLVAYAVHRFGIQVLEVLNRYFFYVATALLALGTIYAMVHWHLFGL